MRQEADVAALLDTEPERIWLAVIGEESVGYIDIRIHPEDQMGEIHVAAESPARGNWPPAHAVCRATDSGERNEDDHG